MKRTNMITLFSALLILLLTLAACGGQTAAPTPVPPTQEPKMEEAKQTHEDENMPVTNAVVVAGQELDESNTVTIDSVNADADGWIVIHAQADGKPGPILGFAPVTAGENSHVTVEIDLEMVTDTLYAMLHVDEGTAGEFEFPNGPDVPAKDAEGSIVTPSFAVEMVTAVTNAVAVSDQQLGEGNTVTIDQITADVDGWIVIHAQADGKSGPILGFAPVTAGENNAVTVEIDPEMATDTLYAMLHVDEGTAGEFEFPDGPDVPAKDAEDNIVTPSFALSIPTVQIGGNDALGAFLAANNGMTLYTFANDANGKSVCYGECATNWPPLLVEAGETPTAAAGISGELGTTTRDDGTIQVTYNGSPLYFWFGDQNPGDAFGNGLGNVWFVVTP